MAHHLDGTGYRIVRTVTGDIIGRQPRVRIPPFDDVELDFAYIPGDDEDLR